MRAETTRLVGKDTPAALQVFVSYSHKDKELLDKQQFWDHLGGLEQLGPVSCWSDKDIPPGKEWKKEIADNLESANIILLLVSPGFVASNFCMHVEVTRALQRHQAQQALVIPITLCSCLWEKLSIGELQALSADGKPMESLRTKNNINTGWKKVMAAIAEMAEQFQKCAGAGSTPTVVHDDRPIRQPPSIKLLHGEKVVFCLDDQLRELPWFLPQEARDIKVDIGRTAEGWKSVHSSCQQLYSYFNDCFDALVDSRGNADALKHAASSLLNQYQGKISEAVGEQRHALDDLEKFGIGRESFGPLLVIPVCVPAILRELASDSEVSLVIECVKLIRRLTFEAVNRADRALRGCLEIRLLR